MSKLYDDIEKEIAGLLGNEYLLAHATTKAIKDIAIKAQIELLEELRIYVLKQGSYVGGKIEQNLYDRIQELEKQLEA